MFCSKCGNEITDGVKFCGKYGVKTEAFSESISNSNGSEASAGERNVPAAELFML